MENFRNDKPGQLWRSVVKSAALEARVKAAPPIIAKFGPNIGTWTADQAQEFTEALIDACLFEVDVMLGGDGALF